MDGNLVNNNIEKVSNWINGEFKSPSENKWIEKYDPNTGRLLSHFANSNLEDVDLAINTAKKSQSSWNEFTPVHRGKILFDIVNQMKANLDLLANTVALETGKPPKDALGEVGAAIMQGEYFAGEGMRLFGRSLTSGMVGKYSHTIRQALGVAGLIVPANTPIANIAWKVFPALICGNSVVLKASEDAPKTAVLFAELTKKAGLPDGVLNVIQGEGKIAGNALVLDPRVDVISFTGSTQVGRVIAEQAGKRLTRVSLELGGKNPFVVCDDADLEKAAHWASLSAFSNAGQRCAAGSRILVFKEVYADFCSLFVNKAKSLKLGTNEGCDLGPVINERQHKQILQSIERAKNSGGKILCGGGVPSNQSLLGGYYIEPTIVEGLSLSDELSCKEIFGPIATIHKIENLQEAIDVSNSTEYGLTSAIHTKDINKAMNFARKVRAGVANINLGTFGSEPHMPFGGFGSSGNGTREPGVEALDVYSELKNISMLVS